MRGRVLSVRLLFTATTCAAAGFLLLPGAYHPVAGATSDQGPPPPGSTPSTHSATDPLHQDADLVIDRDVKEGKITTKRPPGHLKPLGSHQPTEGVIDSVTGFVEPKVFFEEYVRPSKPVLFKGAAKGIPAYSLWTDAYLQSKYGRVIVDVEEGKKENRSQNMLQMPLQQFLEVYLMEEIYMVQDVVPQMKDELSLPKCLWCGGFQERLELGVLWFSSGGTKSVLHFDNVDNINCLLDGEKTLVMIDKQYEDAIEAHHFVSAGSFSRVDVDKVDMYRFPNLRKVPWWSAKMEKGDCMFIPNRWYHTVESSRGRNLAVNLWFVHLLWFNQTDCDARQALPPEYDTLSKYELHEEDNLGSVEKIRSDAFEPFEGLKIITFEDCLKVWKEYGDHADIIGIFETLDENRDMLVTWEEVFKVDILQLSMDFPYIMDELAPEDLEDMVSQREEQEEDEIEEEDDDDDDDDDDFDGFPNDHEEL